jgi:hypothetical protein
MLKQRLLQDQSEASLRFDKKSQQVAWLKALQLVDWQEFTVVMSFSSSFLVLSVNHV